MQRVTKATLLEDGANIASLTSGFVSVRIFELAILTYCTSHRSEGWVRDAGLGLVLMLHTARPLTERVRPSLESSCLQELRNRQNSREDTVVKIT